MTRNPIARDLRTPKYRQRVINGRKKEMPSYWNADSDLDWRDAVDPPEEYASECDCCGKMKVGCVDLVWAGMDTHACPECRGEEDNERV